MSMTDDRATAEPSQYSMEGIRNLFGNMTQQLPNIPRQLPNLPQFRSFAGRADTFQPQNLEAPPMQRLLPSPQGSVKEIFVAAPEPNEAPPKYGRMFPTAFTFICFVAFGPPTVSALVLVQDASVRYFVGQWGLLVLAVPILLVVCHLLHLRAGRPRRIIVLVSTIAPCILFIIVGNVHAVVAGDLASRLYSTDCTTFEVKRELNKEWLAAEAAYNACLGETAPHLGLTVDDSLKLFRLHHCTEYPANFTKHREAWAYLREMEEHQACSGWCTVGTRLWSYNNPHDSCSVAAATVMDFKIRRIAVRMISYTAFALVVILVALLLVGPFVRKSGMDW
eukprot:gnl/MRDRNA2_/MRDRNA2_82954_c0_seq1.p1 gnl/MRDRNA2_/MRDRNA2_82954_c0~~gnl/MRDRNA2_/MRDRNA2_82954_c0_seq1.p1  ORF type:complete len:336 (-),score=65.77 gnl/MRDRNA2_/MRDRNA2_82954_c0_seq1:64-1071(-)